MFFLLSLVSAPNNFCEPELGNDFCDVMTFASLWSIRFYDRMELECSSQGIMIHRAVVQGLLELNCDWLKISTSQKSFPGSGSQQTLFSVETSDIPVCFRLLVPRNRSVPVYRVHIGKEKNGFNTSHRNPPLPVKWWRQCLSLVTEVLVFPRQD